MYFIKKWIFRKVYKLLKKTPDKMPMVKYWKTKDSCQGAITTNKDGAIVMKMEGEDYDFPGFPRSHLLFGQWKDRPFGPLSVLKHEIKNQIFNENWKRLENGESIEFRKALDNIYEVFETMRYDMIPPNKMFLGVRELYKAFTRVQEKHPESKINKLRDVLCFILQEDDAYRFRVMWIIQVFSMFRNPIKNLDIALGELEHAEVVSDMKERIRLLRKILLKILEDKKVKQLFLELWKEMKWNKLIITELEKYHFRPKWFKVDFDKFEY